jgi:predicted dehydrogenase
MIRWGMIGCGDVAEVKSGPAFAKAPGSALVAVMRRDRAKAETYARRHGVPRFYDDASALLADPEVDAVYVATPPSSHKQYVLAAAQANKPVYAEKPMGVDHAECVAMVEACARAGVPLFSAYYRRALPRFLAIKKALDEGALGEVRMVTVVLSQPPDPSHTNRPGLPRTWRVDPAIAGGGLFMDLACHTLDLLDHFLGPIVEAAGHASNQAGIYEAEDNVVGHFRFASGATGVGAWAFATAERADRTEIAGTRGRIVFSTFADVPVQITASGQTTEIATPHPQHVQGPLIQAIVDELRGDGRSPSTGENATRTAWVMDRMLESYRRSRR